MADYNVNAVAACCGKSLHYWKLNGTDYKDTSVEHVRPLTSVAWNRNNKVLATGIVDGSVQLRYGSGELMTELPRGGPPPDSGAITSLSWSVGSKRLAAGTTNGAVYVHEMTTKSCHTLSSPTPQAFSSSPALVDFQSDDKYLAVASTSTLKLYAANTLQHIANLSLPASSSNRHHHHTALASPVTENVIATGTNKGIVLLWDVSSQTLKESYNISDSGDSAIITTLQFAPLQPTVLFTATANGCLSMLDRRTGATASFPKKYTAAGIASLSIKEDCSLIAVGTHDGKVVLYDPRNTTTTSRPLYELQCDNMSRGGGGGESAAVTGIHWQHNYSSLSSRAKAAVLENMLPFAMPLQKEKKEMQDVEAEGKEEENTEEQQQKQQQPVLLDSTNAFLPATTTTIITPARPTLSSSHSGLGMITPLEASFRRNIESRAHAMIHGGGGGDDNNNNNNNNNNNVASSTPPLVQKMQQQQEGKPSTLASIVVTNKPLNASATTTVNNNGNGVVERKGFYIVGECAVQRSPIEVTTSTSTTTTSPASSSSFIRHQKDKEEESGANVWSMRHPPPSVLKTADMARNDGTNDDFKIAAHSPVKSKLLGGGGFGSGMVAQPTTYDKGDTSNSGHGLREDILALHFDMLTQFQAQQTQMAELCSGIMCRQESLEQEVVALRKQLAELLSRRDATVWM
jgi:hypothetical protein